MKELRYILAVLFSSLIIISGVGISVVQYCCAGCETTQSCCTSGCSKCHHAHRGSQKTCKDTGCTAVYYKVDFVKHAHESVSFVPFLILFCEHCRCLITPCRRWLVLQELFQEHRHMSSARVIIWRSIPRFSFSVVLYGAMTWIARRELFVF